MATAAMTNRSTALRRVLLLDAGTSGTMGLLLLLGAGLLAQPLGLPRDLLRWTGLILIPFAAALVRIATRPNASAEGVRAIIVLNVLWALGTPLLLVTNWASPTLLGELFVLVQAAAVAGFAYLEHRGSR
jgi:hypothetical protein